MDFSENTSKCNPKIAFPKIIALNRATIIFFFFCPAVAVLKMLAFFWGEKGLPMKEVEGGTRRDIAMYVSYESGVKVT